MEAVQRQQQSVERREGLRGQVIIIFALASLVLVGMLALAVDVGMLLAERRQVQSAADAGALAAANATLASLSPVSAGRAYGAMNADVPLANVQVNQPPTQGRFAGDSSYIEVVVTKEVERYFLGAIYQGPWEVQARAVAVVEAVVMDAAILALNPDSGGIQTGGSTYLEAQGGSIVSNYNINGSGYTTLISSHQINANDGILRSGTVITNAPTVNPSAAEVEDPLAEMLQPPVLPSSPGNTIPNVNPATVNNCPSYPGWYEASGVYITTATPGTYNNCTYTVTGRNEGPFTFPSGNWRFNGGGLNLGYQDQVVYLNGGTWNFNGGQGINLNGYPTTLDMRTGNYSFTGGAGINIGGNSYGNHIGGNFYFHGGGGITAGGYNAVTLYPGVYVFDGGTGINFSGNSTLHFAPGNYEFWFLNGADFTFNGSARITSDPGAYARMYFYGTENNFANLSMSGDSDMVMPSGQYYFDRGSFTASGSSKIRASNVFFYYKNGGFMRSNGMSGFAFTAPTTEIYPGYVPGVFVYSDRDNTAEFEWTGYTSAISRGIVYLPSSPVVMSGFSNGKVFEGQFIADSYKLSGNNKTIVEYYQFIEAETPKAYLVD